MSLFVIPDPGTSRTVFAAPEGVSEDWVFVTRGEDDGNLDLACGSCDRTLAKHLTGVRDVTNVVFRCPTCGTCNTTRQ